MNYLSSISHRILFFGQFWPIFILEAGYHFEKYESFVALQRRDSHIKELRITNWSAEWPAQTLLLTITSELVIASPLFSSLKTGLALQDPSPLQYTMVSHIPDGRGTWAGEGPLLFILTAKKDALRKTLWLRWAWRAKGRSWWAVINNRWLSVVDLQGKFYHFPVWGLGNLRNHGGEVVCQGALAVTLLFLIY